MEMAFGPEMRITAMAPVPEGVAKATMLSVYDIGQKYKLAESCNILDKLSTNKVHHQNQSKNGSNQ